MQTLPSKSMKASTCTEVRVPRPGSNLSTQMISSGAVPKPQSRSSSSVWFGQVVQVPQFGAPGLVEQG